MRAARTKGSPGASQELSKPTPVLRDRAWATFGGNAFRRSPFFFVPGAAKGPRKQGISERKEVMGQRGKDVPESGADRRNDG